MVVYSCTRRHQMLRRFLHVPARINVVRRGQKWSCAHLQQISSGDRNDHPFTLWLVIYNQFKPIFGRNL